MNITTDYTTATPAAPVAWMQDRASATVIFGRRGDDAATDAAAAFVATMPKYVKAHVSTMGSANGSFVTVSFNVNLTPNAVTGEFNEAGVKRVRKFAEALATVGTAYDTGFAFNNNHTVAGWLAAAGL